jgi:hypothetical protein
MAPLSHDFKPELFYTCRRLEEATYRVYKSHPPVYVEKDRIMVQNYITLIIHSFDGCNVFHIK